MKNKKKLVWSPDTYQYHWVEIWNGLKTRYSQGFDTRAQAINFKEKLIYRELMLRSMPIHER